MYQNTLTPHINSEYRNHSQPKRWIQPATQSFIELYWNLVLIIVCPPAPPKCASSFVLPLLQKHALSVVLRLLLQTALVYESLGHFSYPLLTATERLRWRNSLKTIKLLLWSWNTFAYLFNTKIVGN